MAILLSDTFTAHPLVASEAVDGELVVLQLDDGVYYGLDALGTLIWRRLAQGYPLEDVARDVVQRYPQVEPERVREDVVNLVSELLDSRLLVSNRADD